VQYAVQHALVSLAVPEVNAFAMPENTASIRVLQKSGFTLVRYEPELERNHYVVTASAQTVQSDGRK